MEEKILYKSKSFTHKFLAKGLLISLLLSTLISMPFMYEYGLNTLHVYLTFKAVMVLFTAAYVILCTKEYVFTDQGVIRKFRFYNKRIYRVGYEDVLAFKFHPIKNAIIGRLEIVLPGDRKLDLAVVPEDDLLELEKQWRAFDLPFEIQGVPTHLPKRPYLKDSPSGAE